MLNWTYSESTPHYYICICSLPPSPPANNPPSNPGGPHVNSDTRAGLKTAGQHEPCLHLRFEFRAVCFRRSGEVGAPASLTLVKIKGSSSLWDSRSVQGRPTAVGPRDVGDGPATRAARQRRLRMVRYEQVRLNTHVPVKLKPWGEEEGNCKVHGR